MKKIVISSDDFGMTYSINEGIRLAYKKGMLSSTNLMVPCPWFEHAVSLSRSMTCDIGVHLTLTNEWDFYKWRPLNGGSSVSAYGGYCYKSIKDLMQNALPRDIVDECRLQIDTVLGKDVKLRYVDLHMCIPNINGIEHNPSYEVDLMHLVSEVAGEYGLPYSFEVNDRGKLKYFDSALSISSRPYEQIEKWLNGLENGVHHLSCHCAVDSYEQSSLTNPLNKDYDWALTYRRVDMRVILSNWFHKVLQKNNITLDRNYFTGIHVQSDTEESVL